MYTEYFGLTEKPFSISPDPRYLYLSQRHADALAHLLYGISDSGGFIQLTGEVGTGKTTLIRCLLEQLPEDTEIALILNPLLSSRQFLLSICQELRIPHTTRDTAKSLVDKLNAALLDAHAEGKRVVLIVDEAQTMSPELLEQVRLLTNLETATKKLLQIILIGQPELREALRRPEMRQIAQRITGRYHLEPLNGADTAVYVAHRIRIAGGRADIFSRRAVRRLYRLSRGIPRLINVIADRALLAAYTRDTSRVGTALVRRAADEVFGRTGATRWWPWAAAACSLALLLWAAAIPDREDASALRLALIETDTAPAADTPAIVAAPESASAGPAGESLAALLARSDAGDDDVTAALFQLWGARFTPEGAPACDQAAAQRLRCLALDGASISELRRLNHPARLSLVGADGETHRIVLSGLDDSQATVVVDGVTRTTDIADLTLYSYGEHLLLFRPSIGLDGQALSQGARGPDVIWLRASLESIEDIDLSSSEPDLFDARLADVVRDYQRDRGLFVDGVVGDRTQIMLQSDLGLVGVPLESGPY